MICIFAAVIRFSGLGQLPTGTYWDEIAILADAKKVALTGTDLHGLSPWHLIYPSYGDYKLAPYIWAVIPFVRLLGATPTALRFPSALAGLATLLAVSGLAYLWTKRFAHRSLARLAALSVALIVAISPWSLLFSRTAFEGHLAQALLGLAALALTAFWEEIPFKPSKNRFAHASMLILAGVLGGFAFWTYFSVRFVWPFVAGFICLYYCLATRQHHRFFMALGTLAVIFTLMLIPMSRDPSYQVSNDLRLGTASILNDPTLPHFVNAQRLAAGNNLLSRLIYTQKLAQAQRLAVNYSRHLDFAYLFLHGDANLRHSTGFTGLFYLWCAPLLIIGIAFLARRDYHLAFVILAWWLIALLPASVPTTAVPHALRSLNALIPACLLIGWGLTAFLQFIFNAINKYKISKLHTICLYIFLALIPLYSLARFAWYYTRVYPTISAPHWQAASTRHAAILHEQNDHFDTLYTLGLDQFLYLWYIVHPDFDVRTLPASKDYRFATLDHVHFDAPAETDDTTGHIFLLGIASLVQDYLANHPRPYSVLYDYQDAGEHYLGVDLEATASAEP